jgi:hypothetical protein
MCHHQGVLQQQNFLGPTKPPDEGTLVLKYAGVDCSPLSTGALHGLSQRVTIPDAVEIQF